MRFPRVTGVTVLALAGCRTPAPPATTAPVDQSAEIEPNSPEQPTMEPRPPLEPRGRFMGMEVGVVSPGGCDDSDSATSVRGWSHDGRRLVEEPAEVTCWCDLVEP